MSDHNHYDGESELNWIRINRIAYGKDVKCMACKLPSKRETCKECILLERRK